MPRPSYARACRFWLARWHLVVGPLQKGGGVDLEVRPSHEIETFVANDTNQHIFRASMSLAEIIEESPKLTPEERRTIYQQIEKWDGETGFEPTSEMLGEGTHSAQTERMYNG